MNDSVGNLMSEGRNKSIKIVAFVISFLVYMGMLGYTGVHNYSLMTAGIKDSNMVIWAVVGVIALELSAMGLPLALHFWTHDDTQRLVAILFYVLDLILLVMNVIIDVAVNTNGQIIGWLELYRFWIVPATPIMAGIGWSIIWMLDPQQKQLAMREKLKAATLQAFSSAVIEASKVVDVTEMVQAEAASYANTAVREVLGDTRSHKRVGRAESLVELPAQNKLPEALSQYSKVKSNGNGSHPLA